MTNEALRQFLASRDACRSAMDWLGHRDSSQMWADCERPDWLLWWAAHSVPRQELVLAACDCAELALRYVSEGENRPRLAIETARRWARGEATAEEVRAADAAAYAALTGVAVTAGCTALTAARAADCAAGAAATAADAARASDAAAYAASYVGRDAAAADAAEATAAAARATMCRLIRARWPECPLPEVAA
jgi:hypothetical protein